MTVHIKPSDKPLYVNTNSSHPSSIIRNIPEDINKRLSALSGNEEIFNSATPLNEEALENAGYHYKLQFKPSVTNQTIKKNHTHKCSILYFNPPYSQGAKTNVGAQFLKLIRKPILKVFMYMLM